MSSTEELVIQCKAAMPGFTADFDTKTFVVKWDSGRFKYELAVPLWRATEALSKALEFWPKAAKQENGCGGHPMGPCELCPHDGKPVDTKPVDEQQAPQ